MKANGLNAEMNITFLGWVHNGARFSWRASRESQQSEPQWQYAHAVEFVKKHHDFTAASSFRLRNARTLSSCLLTSRSCLSERFDDAPR